MSSKNWIPGQLNHIAGNLRFKEYARNFIDSIRRRGSIHGLNMLLEGDRRSGKTSGLTYLLQCLGCLRLDFEQLAPCQECDHCRFGNHVVGNDGWEEYPRFLTPEEAPTPILYSVTLINGPRFGLTMMDNLFKYIEKQDVTIRVVQIDEVHRMEPQVMAAMLAPMDTMSAIWLASSAPKQSSINGQRRESEEVRMIRSMFRDRFTHQISTQLPSKHEYVQWMADRCVEFEIRCVSPADTLGLIAERTLFVPGRGIRLLDALRSLPLDKRIITPDYVNDFSFSSDL